MKYLLIGKFIKPFGVKGGVIVEFYVDDEEELQSFSAFYVKDKLVPDGMRPIAMGLKPHGGRFVATMDEVTTPEQAELFRSREIFVDESELPQTGGDEFYLKDLLGATFRYEGADLGVVKDVFDAGGGDIFLIRLPDGKEIAIPFRDEYIESVDTENSLIVARNIGPLL